VTAAYAEKQPKERYRPIVDRQMFGRVPEGFDPSKPPSTMTKEELKQLEQQQEQLRSAIRLSAINIRPSGAVAVGFTDNGVPAKPIHYYLGVGETRDGWLVKAADPKTAVAVIAKGEVEVTLTLGEDSAQKADATARAGAAKHPSGDVADAGDPQSALSAEDAAPTGGFRERRRRRMQREEEERRRREQADAERKAEREDMKNQLEDLRAALEQNRLEQERRNEQPSEEGAAPKEGENADGQP